MFPDFSERMVKIKHQNQIFSVPKLSVLQYSHVMEIISQVDSAADLEIACEKLWLLLENVLPETVLCDRNMFPYNDLVELCMYLAFGTYLDDKFKENAQKFYEPSILPECQFKAARILSQFSAYTIEKLMNEPASIFFALSDYAERVRADNAAEFIADGIKAAFSSSEQLNSKRGSLTIPNPKCTQTDILQEYRHEVGNIKKY